MKKNIINFFGLRTRIVLVLSAIFALFILITEATVSHIVQVTLERNFQLEKNNNIEQKELFIVQKEKNKARRLIVFYMVTGSLIALFLGSFAITKIILRPLSNITQAVEKVAAGNLSVRAPVKGSGEIVRLLTAFNSMAAELEKQRDELKRRILQLEKSSTELKLTQDQLIRSARLASVGTIASGIAHEIGNPLAGVIGLLDNFKYETDREKVGKLTSLMQKEIGRIDRIISRLLKFARPSKSSLSSQKALCNPKEVFDNVRTLVTAQKQLDNVEIVSDFSCEDVLVKISSDNLSQLFLNLLLNAANAMNSNGKITVKTEYVKRQMHYANNSVKKTIEISITDNGPGVSRDIRDKIFDPFFTTDKSQKGSGLGLSICQNICESAGGEIILDKDYKHGARFSIFLNT